MLGFIASGGGGGGGGKCPGILGFIANAWAAPVRFPDSSAFLIADNLAVSTIVSSGMTKRAVADMN